MGIVRRAREEYSEGWQEASKSDNSALGFALIAVGVLCGWLLSHPWGVVGWPVGILIGLVGGILVTVAAKTAVYASREYRAMRRRLREDEEGEE